MVKVFAPAKVNLALHVTGQRADGYHHLDSFVMFADVGDWVEATDAAQDSLTVFGGESAGAPDDDRNSLWHAARFLGARNLTLTLEKNLPTAAGIGGGTADCAAAIKAICELRGLDIPLDTLKLGADVPVCMAAKATRMSGIGEALTPIKNPPEIFCVLVNPRIAVPTPLVFKALANKNNTPMPVDIPTFSTAKTLAHWLGQQRNDLEIPARSVQPVITQVLCALQRQENALLTRMSGSGATCFSIFETAAQAQKAAQDLSESHSDWWVKSASLI